MTINPGYALHIVTDRTVNAGTGAGAVAVPETAVVNGSVTVSDSSFLYFDCSILPSELQEHPLLAVKGMEDIADSGRLNLNGDILVRFGGYDFGETDTVDKKYYLATTESGIYVDGALGGFQTRTISIGNGWFGIIKVSGDNMNLVMTVTNTPIRTWYNGENRSEGNTWPPRTTSGLPMNCPKGRGPTATTGWRAWTKIWALTAFTGIPTMWPSARKEPGKQEWWKGRKERITTWCSSGGKCAPPPSA